MKQYRISLNKSGSVQRAIDNLESYKRRLEDRVVFFKKRLIEVGIKTAQANSGEYGSYITFSCENLDSEVSFLQGKDNQLIVKEWYASKKNALEHKNVRRYEISPLLMAEFGSGFLAKVLYNIGGVGQGTMPDQKHAFDASGWYWYDEDGVKHHSEGENPTFPMHAANMAMLFEVDRIAREVFRNI